MSPPRLGYNLGHVLSLLDHILWEEPYHQPRYGEFHTVRNWNLLQTSMSVNLKVDPSAQSSLQRLQPWLMACLKL